MDEFLLSVVRLLLLRLSLYGNGGLEPYRNKQVFGSNLSGSNTSILAMSHKDVYHIH